MPSPLPDSCKREIAVLTQRHKVCRTKLAHSPKSKPLREEMAKIFQEACRTIRDLDSNDSPRTWDYADALLPILREGTKLGIKDSRIHEILEYRKHYGAPIWVEDASEVIPERFQDSDREMDGVILGPTISYSGNKVTVEPDEVGYGTEPWKESTNQNPRSSPLARFRPNLPTLTSTPGQISSSAVHGALCEISSLRKLTDYNDYEAVEPIKLQISSGGTCLALLGTIGRKTKYPWIGYSLLDRNPAQPLDPLLDRSFQAGLAEVASHMAIDEARKLILVADEIRVKTYAWGDSRRTFEEALPTHTLDSHPFKGPIISLPNGTILRAGRGAAATWVIDDLDTHGPKGTSVIGNELYIDEYDEENDEPAGIEESGGTPCTSYIRFKDEPTLQPTLWERLPGSSTVICAGHRRSGLGQYGNCLAIDLEHNAKTVTRFRGYRSIMTDFSTNSTDPRAFLASSDDGFARLFDLRQSYPVVEFKVGDLYECQGVALAHPDGVPTVFTGTGRREQIKVWDVRAKACVYELATGNNSVKSLAWDAKNNTLFAATSCSYRGESTNYAYRPAKIPKRRDPSHPNNAKEGPKPRCWPRQSWHSEDYFEYTFDAGEDRVYCYAFKQNPDRYILPEYGDAQEDSYTIDSDDEDSEVGYGRYSDDDEDDEDDTDEY